MVHTGGTTSKRLPQYIAAIAAAGGALAAGTILGWSSPSSSYIVTDKDNNGTIDFVVNKDEFAWISSSMTLGAAFICMPIGFLINIIGRKFAMLLMVLPFTVGWALLIWAQNVAMFYIGRILLGICCGAYCVAAPLYIGEIAQKEIRGTLGTFFQLLITSGILFVYAVGAGLSLFWMQIVCGIIPLIVTFVLAFMPESPTFLIIKNNEESAIKSIQWLRGDDYDYHMEIDELKANEAKRKQQSVSVINAFGRRESIKALIVSLGLMFFQQLSGINAVIFYTNDIFKGASNEINPQISTIIVGIMQVIATFISTLVVDKLGRRVLLLTSASVMALSTLTMGIFYYMKSNDVPVTHITWLPILCLCIFIIMFSIGFGPVPWLMMGEVFSSDIKGIAGSIAGTTNWGLAFIVTKVFVTLNSSIGGGPTFWIFSAITAIGVLFVYFIVPETKGKSLNEIQMELSGNRSRNQE